MSYFPGSPTGGSGPTQANFGAALALGVVAAVASALVVGAISGLINIQFAYGAILIGYAVGASMRRFGRTQPMALASAIIAVVGSALSSVVAWITYVVHHHVPLSYVTGHLSTVNHYLPLTHYVGFLGFVFWVLAAWIGWVSVTGRGRYSGRRMRGYRGANQPYGNPGPYGSGSPYGTPAGPGQPYFPGEQPNAGQQGSGTPDQSGHGTPDYSGPGFAMPQDQPPGQNPQQGI
jgi:hypothetical protein